MQSILPTSTTRSLGSTIRLRKPRHKAHRLKWIQRDTSKGSGDRFGATHLIKTSLTERVKGSDASSASSSTNTSSDVYQTGGRECARIEQGREVGSSLLGFSRDRERHYCHFYPARRSHKLPPDSVATALSGCQATQHAATQIKNNPAANSEYAAHERCDDFRERRETELPYTSSGSPYP